MKTIIFGEIPLDINARHDATRSGINGGYVFYVTAVQGLLRHSGYERFIFLSRRELDIADKFFQRSGALAVLIARLLPVIRTFIALPAGIARMPRLKFHIYTFIGSWPWCFMLAYVGMKLGQRWQTDPRLKIWFHRLDAVILAVIVLGVGYFIWSHARHRMGAENAARQPAD